MIHCCNDVLAAQSIADLNAETFARKQIDDGQRSNLTPVGKLVRHEIHSPDIIGSCRRRMLFPVHCGYVAPRPFTP